MSWGGRSKVTQTCGLNSIYPPRPGAQKSEMRGRDGLFSEDPLPPCKRAVSVSSRGGWGLSGVSSYKDTSPIRSGPTLMTSCNLDFFLKTLSPNVVTLRVRASS